MVVKIALPGDRVLDLWWAPFAVLREEVPAPLATLSEEEISRGRSFLDPLRRENFLLARGMLRELLASYLGRHPETLHLERNLWGKPFLAKQEPSRIAFSVAHSELLTVVAITAGREVGVDVEPLRPVPEATRIAVEQFCKEEARALSETPKESRDELFLRFWTLKEAYAKLRGGRLVEGLALRVWPLPEVGKALRAIGPKGKSGRSPTLVNLRLEGHIWGLAVDGQPETVHLRRFSDGSQADQQELQA